MFAAQTREACNAPCSVNWTLAGLLRELRELYDGQQLLYSSLIAMLLVSPYIKVHDAVLKSPWE